VSLLVFKIREIVGLNRLKSQTISNHDLTSISKRSSTVSSSQKNLNLTAAQRLDNLIQGAPNDLTFEGKDNKGLRFYERNSCEIKNLSGSHRYGSDW
jgi:hypothetical protein